MAELEHRAAGELVQLGGVARIVQRLDFVRARLVAYI